MHRFLRFRSAGDFLYEYPFLRLFILQGIPKLRLIREVVIPTIASTGFSQSLVSELESALTGFEMIK